MKSTITRYGPKRPHNWHGADWQRIHAAEDRLINYFLANRGTERSELCWNKAQDLRDQYDSQMSMTKKEYYCG